MSTGHDTGGFSLASRIGGLLLAAVVGVVYGAVATVGHRHVLRIGEVAIPWGIIAALVGVAALLLGIRLLTHGRAIAAATAAGLVVIVAVLTLPGPGGGSVLVAGDVAGTVWAVAPALIAVLIVAWPELPSRRRSRAAADAHA
ncbi:hypothetical protein [Agromyces italicus]|uniref:hypothetical protein n=1 Tax=Agromyces italicus TaxID=279572 RepID=UPI0003B75990|nr:hypothetical protein [Agromyces italicus]